MRSGGALSGGSGGVRPSLRRCLQYGSLLAAVVAAASGLALLVEHALPAAPWLPPDPARGELALGLSLTMVGVPAWLLLWRLVARRLARDPGERASLAWTLYLAAAVTLALVAALANLVQVGAWAAGADEFEAGAVAAGSVWAAAWVLHVRVAGHRGLAPTGPFADLVVLAGAAVGLLALVAGAAGVVSFGLEQVYRAVAHDALAEGVTTEALRRDLVLTLVAVCAWWWHWLRSAAGAPRSTLWQVHVVLLGVLGGLLAATAGAAAALDGVLRWFLVSGAAVSAASHFEVLPGALTAVTVGGWSWWYHRSVLAEGDRRRTEAERAYEHAAAAAGLVAAAAGATSAVVAAVQAATFRAVTAPGGRGTLVTALTLLLVGVPLWGLYWRRLQRHVAAGDGGERRSASRRAYLALVLGAAGLGAAVSVAVMVLLFTRDLLEGALGASTLYDLRVALALAVTAAAVAGYHWTVSRGDRAGRAIQGEPR